MSSGQPVHLLWTGGWDSTFRLLQLLERGETIQPHYLIDSDRRSTGAELYTMKRIKDAIQAKHPEWSSNLLPTRFSAVDDIPENPEITRTYWRMRERAYFGSQYEWLARYCAHSGIHWFDFGYNSSGPRGSRRLRQYYKKADGGDYYIIDPKYRDLEEYTLFGYYHFSLGETTKVEMREMAAQAGYLDILNLSWFCHTPLPNMTPCGTCAPCSSLMEEDMRWRLPWHAQLRYYLPGKAMLKRFLIHNKALYRQINRLRHGQADSPAARQDLDGQAPAA